MDKKVAFALAATSCVAFAASGDTRSFRTPVPTPVHDANMTGGYGCFVRGVDPNNVVYDSSCIFNQVIKQNKDGTYAFFKYTDNGALQPGQESPDTPLSSSFSYPLSNGQTCTVTELITPGGRYSSTQNCG